MVSRSLDSDEVLSLLTLGEAFALFLKLGLGLISNSAHHLFNNARNNGRKERKGTLFKCLIVLALKH